MENIDNVKLFIKSLDGSIDQLKEQLKPIINIQLDELIGINTTKPIEVIKFYNNYLYTLISLIFSYLKTIGVKVEDHPIMNELNRIKAYMKRLKEFELKLLKDESKDEKKSDQAKKFLENTLGSKLNGGGAAKPQSLSEPAISSSNFKGKHTKFNNPPTEEDATTVPVDNHKNDIEIPLSSDSKSIKKSKISSKNVPKPSSSGKITKPKGKGKSRK